MKLRTSYFNATVLKKDITRFAPVWGLYSVALLLFITMLNDSEPARIGNNVVEFMNMMLWVNLIYAGICGNLLLGDLFNPRMCNALHAMPLRREGWLLTHLVSGLVFFAMPNVVATVIIAVMLQQYYYLALIWLGAAMLQFLFFFGVSVFSVMCSGNRLGMAAVYLIINWFGAMAYVMAQQFYEPLLYGIRLDSDLFQFFSPSFHLVRQEFVYFDYDKIMGGIFNGFGREAWHYLFAIAAIGLMLMFFAVLLYRRRNLECAGDFMALKPLKPVFLVIYTLGVGVVLSYFTELFGTGQSYIFLCAGIVVGFFTGLMLLERTVRVFRLKSILGFAVFAVVFTASMYVTYLDPAGITRYVPDVDDIQWMRIYDSSDSYIYEDPDNDCYQLTDPEELKMYRQIHQQLLSDADGKAYSLSRTPSEWSDVRILYRLKDGSSVIRYYYMDPDTSVGQTLKTYLSSWEYLFRTQDWNGILSSTDYIDVHLEKYDEESYKSMHYTIKEPAQVLQFLEAARKDCDAETLVQDWVYHPYENTTGWVTVYLKNEEQAYDPYLYTIDFYCYQDCTNIFALLDTLPPDE